MHFRLYCVKDDSAATCSRATSALPPPLNSTIPPLNSTYLLPAQYLCLPLCNAMARCASGGWLSA